jgi:hypothetical protein
MKFFCCQEMRILMYGVHTKAAAQSKGFMVLQTLYKFGQALFKLGEINEDEDSVAAHDSLRARNRSGSPANSIGDKYCKLLLLAVFFANPNPPTLRKHTDD